MMQNYRYNSMSPHMHRPMLAPMPISAPSPWCDKALAMAYVPWQEWRDIYETEKALHCGTIFKELNLPFIGKGGAKR